MSVVERFREARSGSDFAVLEGFHAVKHAIRFDADFVDLVTVDPVRLTRLGRSLAPDVVERLSGAEAVDEATFGRLSPKPPDTGVIGLAARRTATAREIVDRSAAGPVVLLERPSRLGNLGAAIRVSAAAGATGLVAVGPHDPWHPEAIRGAAGLQFAIPVARAEGLPVSDRPWVAVDPSGSPLGAPSLPDGSIFAFGSERRGLSREILDRADRVVAIPMRTGVSSLNLATAVAVVLYAWMPEGGRR